MNLLDKKCGLWAALALRCRAAHVLPTAGVTLAVGYNRCVVRFNTHSVGGISENDFICAAKCDALFAAAPGS